MASTFANRDTNWYVRAGGAELNGGGFDSTVTNAGTNYANQDAAQISSTTGTCTVASTTWTDTSVTFTALMIGNIIRISARTGGSAIALDYFVVTAFIDANNITLDRTPCASANITAATYCLGGAHVHIKSYATTSGSGSNNPVLATPLIGGNTINIRGSGSMDPGSSDFDWSADYWNFPSGGNQTNGNCKITGYNGRPRISHRGLLWFTGSFIGVRNLSLYQSNNTWTTHNPFDVTTASYYNCIFDTAGIDGQTAHFGDSSNKGGSMLCCEIRNTGGGAVGSTNHGVRWEHGGGLLYGTWIHSVRSNGVVAVGVFGAMVNCLVNSCGGDGFKDLETDGSAPIPQVVLNCTFNANSGHGLNIAANGISNNFMSNNIISNHTATGKVGINFADTRAVNIEKYRFLFGYNDYFGNTADYSTVSGSLSWAVNPVADGPLTGDLTLDPQYVNAGSNDFTPGNNVKGKGLLWCTAFSSTTATVNMGGVFT